MKQRVELAKVSPFQLSRKTLNTLAALTIVLISMLTRAALSAPQELGDGLPDTVAGTEVVIPASGIVLTGYEVRPSPNGRNMPGVLLLHSSGADAQRSLDAARSLADRGYIALAISMRGARSLAEGDDCGAQQADDAVQALNWLGQQSGVDSSRLGLLGFGQGGQIALLAASRTTLPRAVVAFSPVSDVAQLHNTTAYKSVRDYIDSMCRAQSLERISPLANVGSITASVLLIHGGRDDLVPSSQSEAMKDALQSAGKQVEFYVLPHAGHEFTAQQFDEAWRWVVNFLARYQMLSVGWRTSEQQRRVNLFTERGWSSRLGTRGIRTVRALGHVTKVRVVITENPHVQRRKDELREFVFDGLYVRALFPGRAHDAYLLQEVKITKLRWKAKFGLNVGTIRSSLLQVLGRPDSEKPDFVEYSHSMGIGTVRIWMIEDRITKLEWEFRTD